MDIGVSPGVSSGHPWCVDLVVEQEMPPVQYILFYEFDVLLSQGMREEERQRREQIAASYEAARRHQEGLEERYDEIYDETEHLLGRLFPRRTISSRFAGDPATCQ